VRNDKERSKTSSRAEKAEGKWERGIGGVVRLNEQNLKEKKEKNEKKAGVRQQSTHQNPWV